ncbi:YggT family protein [Alteribacter natronophilus]|uniref:YggT family protein n=1 Tax=Alteribacter natronophilus TaxID=2583810 RepID=UPI00110D7165|nr:YggT family protein [Alteribacter natronophilus]TMW73140.1 YggT family protein [Alteribacter natronophilus]
MGALFSLLNTLLFFYTILVFIYIFMSWVPNLREGAFGQMVGRLVEPFLTPFRNIIPPMGMIDISPIVAMLTLYFARMGLAQLAQYF